MYDAGISRNVFRTGPQATDQAMTHPCSIAQKPIPAIPLMRSRSRVRTRCHPDRAALWRSCRRGSASVGEQRKRRATAVRAVRVCRDSGRFEEIAFAGYAGGDPFSCGIST